MFKAFITKLLFEIGFLFRSELAEVYLINFGL